MTEVQTCALPVSGERERHAVPAQTVEQTDPERPRALHPYAAVAERRVRPELGQPAGPDARYGTHQPTTANADLA